MTDLHDAFAGVGDVSDPVILDAGYEDVQIVNAELHTKQNADEPSSIRVDIEVVDRPEVQSLIHYVAIPLPEDSDKKRETKLRMAASFAKVFGIADEELADIASWVGREGRCYLRYEPEDEKNGYPAKNSLKLPKLADD